MSHATCARQGARDNFTLVCTALPRRCCVSWWQTQLGVVTGIPLHDANGGAGYVGIVAERVPDAQLATSVQWLTATLTGSSVSWSPVPSSAATITFTLADSNESVLLLADISRVHQSANDANSFFRIVVDGSLEVANWNTANYFSTDSDAVSFHGVVSGLSSGYHTAELQYKVRAYGVTQTQSHQSGPFPSEA